MQNIKIIFWLVFLALVFFLLYEVSSILTPFVVSIIIAYFLDPLTLKLEKHGIRRSWTVTIIVGMFFFISLTSLLNLIPSLFEQIRQFIIAIPDYENYISVNILDRVKLYLDTIDPELSDKIHSQLSASSSKFFEYIIMIINNIFDSSIAFLNIIGLIFFTPILVFYFLRDWPNVVKTIREILPIEHKKLILDQLNQIGLVLSAYVRGQISVCFILSVFYVLSLSIVGLEYALLIGIVSGLLSIIPYLGLLISGSICAVVVLLQFGELKYLYITLAIVLTGHLLESYVITPKLVGEKVGLHPVWVIFALMTGGALFGFWGIFFAIPIAAIIGVIVRSLLKIYLASYLYKDAKKR